MARLIRQTAIYKRAELKFESLIAEAMDAGENQTEIARIVGRSKQHIRNVRRRVAARESAEREGT
jgi:hypothetical protein